jgi:DnaJ-class molecular chaperone
MSKRDYYEILGLDRNASPDDIRKKYRQLASKYHPDKLDESEKSSGEEKFKEAKEAYEILSDPEKKSVYDQYGHRDSSENSFSRGQSQTWMFKDMGDMQDILSTLFRQQGFGSGARQRATSIAVLNISLKDAYTGRTIKYDANTTIIVPRGIRSGTKLYVDGKFYQIDVRPDAKFKRSLDDLMVEINITAIEAMLGIDATLDHLDGNKLQFTISPGIQTGQIVKLSHMGMKNPESESTGDMLVRISVIIPRDLSNSEKALLGELPHRNSITI